MATWPASLPQVVPADEFEESAEDNRIRTDVDAGPAKVRPRYSAEVVRVRFDLRLTLTQVGTLETFLQDHARLWRGRLRLGRSPHRRGV
jgi:hypothetical protein